MVNWEIIVRCSELQFSAMGGEGTGMEENINYGRAVGRCARVINYLSSVRNKKQKETITVTFDSRQGAFPLSTSKVRLLRFQRYFHRSCIVYF